MDKILEDRTDQARPIALFAERAVPKKKGKPLPFFSNAGNGRAVGPGIPPIIVNPNDQQVGSEGLVANFITELVRYHGGDVLSHPGPDRMRNDHVRNIVIVTDFIGSGKRVWEMLEAFRAVATLRSWRSYHLIRFNVLAYSGTEEGVRLVGTNRLKPQVTMITGCPTLWNTFHGAQLKNVLDLCRKYPGSRKYPLGWSNGGALIAFSHGMPNNSPPILHSRRNWTPLFRGRSTLAAEAIFPTKALETVADRAARLLKIEKASRYLADPTGKRWITTLLVLAALKAGAHSTHEVSAQTGLPLSQIEEILSYTRIVYWITKKNGLTKLGRQELARLRRRRDRAPVLSKSNSFFYYPSGSSQ